MGRATSVRSGAAYTVAGECERLFCETLRAVFLGESRAAAYGSLSAAGVRTNSEDARIQSRTSVEGYEQRASAKDQPKYREMRERKLEQKELFMRLTSLEPDRNVAEQGLIRDWVEVFDYRGDASFRGFVAEDAYAQRALLVFFEQTIAGKELKHG